MTQALLDMEQAETLSDYEMHLPILISHWEALLATVRPPFARSCAC